MTRMRTNVGVYGTLSYSSGIVECLINFIEVSGGGVVWVCMYFIVVSVLLLLLLLPTLTPLTPLTPLLLQLPLQQIIHKTILADIISIVVVRVNNQSERELAISQILDRVNGGWFWC